MNFSLKKLACTVFLGATLTLNTMTLGFALSQNVEKQQKNISIQIQNLSGPVDTASDKSSLENSKTLPQPLQQTKKKSSGKYTLNELSNMSYDNMINTVVKIKWNDIKDLFQYTDGAQRFYSDQNRLQAVIDALAQRGSQFTTKDDMGIPTLVEILRGGFYTGFYNKELKQLNDRKVHDQCIPAILATMNNPNYKLGTQTQDEVVGAIGKLVSNASCNTEIINKATPILKQYNDNFDAYIKERSKGSAIYDILQGIEYDTSEYLRDVRDPKNTPFYGRIDNYIAEIEKIGRIKNINNDNTWLVNNAIWSMARVGRFHTDSKKGIKFLVESLNIYPKLSEPYMEVIKNIDYIYRGKDANGNTIDTKAIKEAAKNKYLPKNYSFDNGKVLIKAGDQVTLEKIKRLYWASKEVKAQFFRMIGSDNALEPGNADDILRIVIYNSPAEYKMNSVLYGYSTDNGGIYIEGDGTFFTYERTPQESIYTLEELFRHEFTHYLQGRYLVPGMWGRGAFYDNKHRLTWFDEGQAEFFAGSTRTNGVQPRRSMVGNILRYKDSDRYSLNQTVHASYNSGFTFYTFAYAFFDYMSTSDWTMFDNLCDAVKSNDVSSFDRYIASIDHNSNLNQSYKQHMKHLTDQYSSLTVPLVADTYLDNHPYKKAPEQFATIASAAKLASATVKINKSKYFNTFALRGTYTGDVAKSEAEDFKTMSKYTNDVLKQFNNASWSGYKTLTAYFVNRRVNANNQFVYDMVFHGIVTDPAAVDGPVGNAKTDEFAKSMKEKENNDTFEKANGKIIPGVTVLASLDGQDKNDMFYFEVESPSKVNIKVKNNGNAGLDFIVYDNSNSKDAVTRAKASSKTLTTSFDAQPGKYYLHVYNYSHKESAYTIDIDGKLNTSKEQEKKEEPTVDPTQNTGKDTTSQTNTSTNKTAKNELEPNDSPKKANNIITSDITVLGRLNQRDMNDIFVLNVENPGKVNINVSNKDNGKIAWTVYKDPRTRKRIANPSTRGITLKGSFDATPGKYYLHVYSFDRESYTYSINVDGAIKSSATTQENKKNSDSIDPNKKILIKGAKAFALNNNISAALNGHKNKEVYYFDITAPKKINVNISKTNNTGMNWVLYHESNLKKLVAYANPSGNKLIGSYDAKPGRYYLSVYKFDRKDASYTLNVSTH
ncbi:collagenase [Crassaminicella profunda]|uniref:collagenase n=1 Tax=Crassaminicella profunda TaxID=1286698 RepID=UPI001CA73B8D|nr:collagenase [Crassaminicella profunda]QZY55254.1 collagenase [Crassaminicella profunda]